MKAPRDTTSMSATRRAPADVSSLALSGLRDPVTQLGSELCVKMAPSLALLSAGSERNDSEGRFPTDAFEALRDAGVLAATVPREFGGQGLSHLHDVAVLLGRIAEVDPGAALAAHMQLSRGLTLSYEVKHGEMTTRALAKDLLVGMAAGTYAIASATKDVGPTTRVDSTAGALTLTGKKTLVSLAPMATHFLVQATGKVGEEVHTLAVLVRRADANVSVHDKWNGVGMRTSGTAEVHFDSVAVDAASIFDRGPVDEESDASLAGQTISSITMLGIYVAITQRARDVAVDHLRDKGASSSAIKTMIADIDTRLFAIRSAALVALFHADQKATDLSGDLDERGRSMMTSFQYAKALVNTSGVGVVDDAIRLVGGLAYTTTHPLWRMSRDIRANVFAHPYNYVNRVDFLSTQAFR